MVAIYNTSLSATSQRHFSDGLGGVTVEYGFATSLSSEKDQIYFTIGNSDDEFSN